jgi:hypothetical protein
MGIGSERQAPADLPPEKRPRTYYTGGYVGPTAGLDRYRKYHGHRDFLKQSGQFLI